MNTMINNPKRTLTINKPVKYVMDRLKAIGAWTGAHAGITIAQANINYDMNYYDFTCDGFFTGIGNKGNVQVSPVNDEQCSLTIEIGRNFGCIDDQWEAQLCSNQIDAFIKLLSELLSKSDNELTPTQEQIMAMQTDGATGNMGTILIGAAAFILICIWIFA